MPSRFSLLAAVTLTAALLQGCAAVMVGGAATGVAVAHDRRTVGTIVDDKTIEVKAAGALNADKDIRDQTHISVTSYNGVVLMTGEAPTQQLIQRAHQIVSGLDKVRKIYNEVIVAAPSSLGSRSSDALLVGKVRARMIVTKGFDFTRVTVVSERGTVYLMGLVYRNEGDLATAITSQTDGVQRVVKLFEYLN